MEKKTRKCNKFSKAVITGVLCLVVSFSQLSFAEKQFPRWDEKVFAEISTRHGEKASERLRNVQELIITHLNDPVEQQLEIVNDYMNGLTWIADSDLWQQEDYWATPFETLTTFGGDCEDIAIAKYAVLRIMGTPDKHLGFAYVVTAGKEAHMVLVYKPSPDADALILDNQHQSVMPAKKRTDLVAVYVFQNDQSLYVIKDKGNADRKLLAKKEGVKLQKWFTAKERAKENRESYVELNNGKPLMPDWVKAN